MIAISIILCEHTVDIYIDTPIKYGYICIYVSSNFILCASLLILKTKLSDYLKRMGTFLPDRQKCESNI